MSADHVDETIDREHLFRHTGVYGAKDGGLVRETKNQVGVDGVR